MYTAKLDGNQLSYYDRLSKYFIYSVRTGLVREERNPLELRMPSNDILMTKDAAIKRFGAGILEEIWLSGCSYVGDKWTYSC
jgi:hypothetical protein